MRFEFSTTPWIIFGQGAVSEVPPVARSIGTMALVVRGRGGKRADPVVESLRQHGLHTASFEVTGEPGVGAIEEGVRTARERGCDMVIAVGGGSVLDAGKAIAALLSNPGEVLDYLEVIGKGMPISRPPAPVIAIPTTAGTGAEVTMNAVLASPEHGVKASLRSPMMLPRLAVIDPELTYSMPPPLTASTGLDALTQLLEAFVSRGANPFTDAFCREGMRRAARSLGRAFADGGNREAREDMALASLFSGLALANAKLGAVHGFAAAIGGMFSAPHGVICARLLGPVTKANIRKAAAGKLDPVLERFREAACIVTGRPQAGPPDCFRWIGELCEDLAVPPLSRFGIRKEHFAEIVSRAKRASSMKGNPLDLSEEELMTVLDGA